MQQHLQRWRGGGALSLVLARVLQALATPPAAAVLAVPPATISARVEGPADDELRGRGGKAVMALQRWLGRAAGATHLVAAAAPGPDALAVVAATEQLLAGPEVDQVHQALATHRAGEAAGVPQGAVVTGTLRIDGQALLGNIALATATALRERKAESDSGVNTTPR